MPKKEKPAQSGGIFPRWISKLLQGSHDHYTCFLPRDIGSFSNLILKLFYSGIKSDEEQLKIVQRLEKNAVVVYVTKYQSNFEYLFYYNRYREKNLLFHGRFSLFAKSCGIATVEVPDFLGDSVVLGFNRSKQWPGPFGFRDNGQEGATVSLKSLENSDLIFYYVPEVLASFEGIKAFNQEEDIDGNR